MSKPEGVREAHTRGRRTRGCIRHQRGTVEAIDDYLLRPVSATLSGVAQQVRTIDAIMLQLLEKGLLGSERAWKVLIKYEAFAQRRVQSGLQVEFVESEYTRSFSEGSDV